MTVPSIGPCEAWATTADLCSPCDDYSLDVALIGDLLTVASEILWVASGRQFSGACSRTVRLERDRLGPHRPGDPAELRGYQYGSGVAATTGSGYRRRSAAAESRLSLGVFPIRTVTQVRVDGTAVDASTWRVDDYRWLTRIDGNGNPVAWQPGRIDVDVTYGQDPPQMGVQAAAELACELYQACQPEDVSDCRLPRRVQSYVRQGVAVTTLDPLEFLDQGRTGLYLPDLFIATYNPARARRRAAIASPDTPQRVRHVNT